MAKGTLAYELKRYSDHEGSRRVTYIIWFESIDEAIVVHIEPRIVIGVKIIAKRLVCLVNVVVCPPWFLVSIGIRMATRHKIRHLQSAVTPAGRALNVASSARSAN